MPQMETSDLCRKPDGRGVFHRRCRHIIDTPKGETAARQCRRAARKNERFCDAHLAVGGSESMGDTLTVTSYQGLIRRLAPEANPRHVEAWMRIAHGTLDHLSAELFRHEVILAVDCIAEAGEEQSEKLAQSFGL
jgi:DNA-binding transcriptional LysR family regulator